MTIPANVEAMTLEDVHRWYAKHGVLREADYREVLHPRGRAGRWVEVPALWPERGMDWQRRWDALPNNAPVVLFHSTNRETAEKFDREGVKLADKPRSLARERYEAGEYAEYQPGAGLATGLTVGKDPWSVSGYGRELLAVSVPKHAVKVPPEQAALGETEPGGALRVNDAMVDQDVPSEDIKRLDTGGRVPNEDTLKQLDAVQRGLYGASPERVAEFSDALRRMDRITRADVEAGRVPGLQMADLASGVAGSAGLGEGVINLTPSSFDPDGSVDSVLLAHEVGHYLVSAAIPDGEVPPELEALSAGRGRAEGRYGKFAGSGARLFGPDRKLPGEFIADSYADLLHGRGEFSYVPGLDGPDDPTYREQARSDFEQNPTTRWLRLLAGVAKRAGLPDRGLWKLQSDGSGNYRLVSRLQEAVAHRVYSEVRHPRNRTGEWVDVPGRRARRTPRVPRPPAAPTPPTAQAWLDEHASEQFKRNPVAMDWARFYGDWTHGDTKVELQMADGGVVKGRFVAPDGSTRGTFTRAFDGRRIAHRELQTWKQAAPGLGTDFVRDSIERARRDPNIDAITMTAAYSAGGYVWAREGAQPVGDWETVQRNLWSERILEVAAAMREHGIEPGTPEYNAYEDLSDRLKAGGFANIQEVAAFGRGTTWVRNFNGVEHTMWPGKALLAGAEYDAAFDTRTSLAEATELLPPATVGTSGWDLWDLSHSMGLMLPPDDPDPDDRDFWDRVEGLQEADFETLHPRTRGGEFARKLRHVIAIDGPAASGKSTVARAVAQRMGGTYIDTGAHFRTAGLARTRGIDPVEALRSGRIRAEGSTVTLDGEDVSDAIRTPAVDRAAASLGGVQEVRDAVQEAVTARLAEGGLFVADGRDSGSALQAEHRIFLTASPDVRAARRAESRGMTVTEARSAILDRDAQDAPRIEAAQAAASHIVDNSNDASSAETVQRIVDLVSPQQATVGTSDFFDRQAEGEKAAVVRPEFRNMALEKRWHRGEFETYQSGMGTLPRTTDRENEGFLGALEFMAERTGHGDERYPVESYERDVQSRLNRLLAPDRSHVAVRVNASSLPAILDANQLVNVHAPEQQRGSLEGEGLERHRAHRAEWEQRVWSIDATHPEDFPIYGYVAGPAEAVARGGVSGFGDTKLRLKPHMRDRSTFTYSDSNWIGMERGTAIPAPVNRPEWTAVPYNHDISKVDALTPQHGVEPAPPPPLPPAMARELRQIEKREDEFRAQGEDPPQGLRRNWEERYQFWLREQLDSGQWNKWKHGDFFEAQIFGGVRFDQDVESVTFTADPDPAVIAKLDALGIPWTVEGVAEEAVLDRLGRRFDRALHPHGRTGLFVDTPDVVKGVSPTQFVGAMEGFSHGGLRLKGRTQRTFPPAGGRARFDVLTSGDEKVGTATYSWQGDTVHFEDMAMIRSLRGSGFGGALMAHALDAWRDLGFDSVETEAVQVGSYGWAKWGFRFKNKPSAEVARIFRDAMTDGRWRAMRERVGDDVLTAFAQAAEDGAFQSPADIAAWGRDSTWDQNGQTFWPGKAVLVGGRWRGSLPL